MTLDIVASNMSIGAAIFSSAFLLLAFLSEKYKKVFLIFSLAFGISTWGLYEYAVYLAGYDIISDMILHPGILIPFLPYFFSSVALLLFLLYLIFKKS